MSTDPEQIRAEVAALLADPARRIRTLPRHRHRGIAARLEEAHDLLVQALEAVERNPWADAPGGSRGSTRDTARSR